jgi:nitrate reductase NapAB chaperone NapD
MALSSIIVQVDISKINQITETLNNIAGVSVEEVLEKGQIIAIIESDTLDGLKSLALKIENMENILGVYPVYIATEDDEE